MKQSHICSTSGYFYPTKFSQIAYFMLGNIFSESFFFSKILAFYTFIFWEEGREGFKHLSIDIVIFWERRKRRFQIFHNFVLIFLSLRWWNVGVWVESCWMWRRDGVTVVCVGVTNSDFFGDVIKVLPLTRSSNLFLFLFKVITLTAAMVTQREHWRLTKYPVFG